MSSTQNATAGPSRDVTGWHAVTLRVPFLSAEHASIAKRALEVDREQNADFVERTIETEGTELIVNFHATTIRLLRLTTNAFLSSVDLLTRTMAQFAPDPNVPPLTDDQLDQIRLEANKGNVKGIELKGDGKGAGSGEEVKA